MQVNDWNIAVWLQSFNLLCGPYFLLNMNYFHTCSWNNFDLYQINIDTDSI